jgi:hypothetical protein
VRRVASAAARFRVGLALARGVGADGRTVAAVRFEVAIVRRVQGC